MLKSVKSLLEYKKWANEVTFNAVSNLPDLEIVKQRLTRFGSIVNTLNHVYVIDDIFKAHLKGVGHDYTDRNTKTHPSLKDLWDLQKNMDDWYLDYAESLSQKDFAEVVEFNFVDGKKGKMSRGDIVFHIVNHGTYHRGFVGDMMYQIPAAPPANDLSVFLNKVG